MFDTLRYAKALRDAGVDEKQAEAHADALREAASEQTATKDDVRRLELKINIIIGLTLVSIAGVLFR